MADRKDRLALIVGAGSGLSASLARAFAGAGYRIALAARSVGKLDGLCAETGASAFACDATKPKEVDDLFRRVDGLTGRSTRSSSTPATAPADRSPSSILPRSRRR